ncbi:phage baseplate assembly protein V [Streptomyces sp. UNOC14_S4]|uniref:phage baseplate assembly protein V n=1 Tax=Streptomyces sp. UNOC14_S4 TaxID=2872340 RepID=UPI001E4BB577|nr:phage baseplate assembly protein V [Streptomyces sp. UNOC14_S4]MCC3766035.1 phage baseplate assembly protein V [Streptomyces sp. UNOC14_S4]
MSQLGIFLGVVSHSKDPAQRHRIRVKIPQLAGDSPQPWASPAFPGSRLPAVGEEVWVFFAGGDPHCPVYLSRP